ncbi:MAG: ATP-dependent DNA helicase UvrD/PcrA, partial [uncultured Solirubrobacteraceae bacterium]
AGHRLRSPHRGPPGGPEPAPAGGGDARERAAADPRGRRLGQDAGAHPPHRPSHPHGGGAAGGDPRHHLHEQGRAGDARARGAPARALHPRDVGHDLPRRLRAPAARRGPPAR